MGRTHLSRSLRTDSRTEAMRLARMVASDFEVLFEEERAKAGLPFNSRIRASVTMDGTVLGTITGRSRLASYEEEGGCEASVQPSSPTLSTIYERFLADPTKKRSDRTMLAHRTTRNVMEDVLGASTPLRSITREDCRELLEILRWLPVNLRKKYPDLTVRSASELARQDHRIATINATNLNAYMARFVTMLNWAVQEEYLERNPARGLQWAETTARQDRRKPFEPWQLQRIFHAPIYTGCKDAQTGYAEPGEVIADGARYWVPLLGLFTGARLNELCQLDVADVRDVDGVACIVITTSSLVGTIDKTLKTRSSERIVPIHPTLHDIGFMAFVARKRKEGSIKLFDDLPTGARGFRSVAFSRWFSRFLISAKANAPQTCFHSFRHGFRDAARNARIERDIALRLGGWIAGGNQSETADDYGTGYHPRILFEAMSRIEFPNVSVGHLR